MVNRVRISHPDACTPVTVRGTRLLGNDSGTERIIYPGGIYILRSMYA